VRQGREMAQRMYAHVNKLIKKKGAKEKMLLGK
jgi:hypothetical protein